MQSIGAVAQGLQNFGSAAVLVLIYLGFLIASRRGAFERKTVRLFATREARHEALNVFLHIRDAVERYLWVQTVTGLIIAIAAFLVMVLVGLEHAAFWAFLVFILNYVPILGGGGGHRHAGPVRPVAVRRLGPRPDHPGAGCSPSPSWSATSSCRACRAAASTWTR